VQLGAEAPVEADRRPVPVEHRPLHPPASALDGQGGEAAKEHRPQAAPPELRADVQVFQVQPRLAQEGGVVVEEEGEAGDVRAGLGKEHLGERSRAEQAGPQVGFCNDGLG
jgi:hypothetical protein